ncbi:MAG: NUDIX hydrolase [Acidobacteriota bacterium]
MIKFEEENNCFNYRVVGVAVHDNRVLLHQAEGDNFWVFPGGRAEFGETAEQTLKREMREELGVEIEVVRLLWVVENFFIYADKQYHEIALYFLMRLPAACKYLLESGPFRGEDEGVELIFEWFPRQAEALSSLPLLPSFLQTSVQELPESAQHIIHRDD